MTRTLRRKIKRQQAKRQAIFLLTGCTAVIGLVLLVFALTASHYAEDNAAAGSYVQTAGEVMGAFREDPVAESETNGDSVSLGIGGDVSFGQEVASAITLEGPGYPWTEVTPIFKKYDITAVNLEGPLCRGGNPNPQQASIYLKGDTSCAAPMADAGIDAVSLANDHIMDYGAAGLEETLNILRAEEVGAFGAGSSRSSAERPLVLGAEDGASVALLSYCDVATAGYAAGEGSPGISSSTAERLSEMVGQAGLEATYVVVFMHWGEIGSEEVTPRQRELALLCVEAGADLVVGCHPHVVQGIEVLQGVPVIYSLGNLVFSPGSEEGKDAVFAGCRFSGGVLTGLEFLPLRIEDGRPVPLGGEDAVKALKRLEEYSPGVQLDISPITGTAAVRL